MVSESEPTDLDREVDESMRLFERSRVGQSAALSPIQPARVLLVLDGSPQDETTVRSAVYLREQFNVETLVLDAREDRSASSAEQPPPENGDELAERRAREISGARPIKHKQGDSYESILAALAEHAVDLVLVPCPYGRSFEHVGSDSAGTVIDVLLSRCGVPMLVIRREDQPLGDCIGDVSLVVGAECDMVSRAAGWAFGLARPGAMVTLNLVVEKEQFENIRSIVEALQPDATLNAEQFAEALTKTHQDLHGAMSKTAAGRGVSYRLRPQAGEVAPPNPLDDTRRMLLVLPLEVDDRYGQGFVQDRIRRSPHPVLVVPGHVPS